MTQHETDLTKTLLSAGAFTKGGVLPAKSDDLVIQPRLGRQGDQELRAICVRAIVGHGQNPGFVEFDCKRLVTERFSVDRAAAVPRAGQDIPSLNPRVSHHAMERAALVAKPSRARAKTVVHSQTKYER